MTDEEVRKWLDPSEGEDVGFDHALQDCRPGDAEVYRRLAVTRKALAYLDPHRNGTSCHPCGTKLSEEHTPDCIFNKIPAECRYCGKVERNMIYWSCLECRPRYGIQDETQDQE